MTLPREVYFPSSSIRKHQLEKQYLMKEEFQQVSFSPVTLPVQAGDHCSMDIQTFQYILQKDDHF